MKNKTVYRGINSDGSIQVIRQNIVIKRGVPLDGAAEKIKFCLDIIEKEGLSKGISFNTPITPMDGMKGGLLFIEVYGALIAAEQELNNRENKSEKLHSVC